METTANLTGMSTLEPSASATVFSFATNITSENQSIQATILDETTLESNINYITAALDFNQSTPDALMDQNTTIYDVVIASAPVTGLTYTLFGLTCLFTALGVLGNGLILVSMVKFRRRSQGHGILIGSLAMSDMVACLTWAVTQPCVHNVVGMDIRAISTVGCKICWAFQFPAMFCSSAIVVLICLERYVAVWFPHKAKEILSKQNMQKAVGICVTPIVLIYATLAVLYCELKDGVCHPNLEGSVKSTVLNRMSDTTVYGISIGFIVIASILILLIFTPLIIVKLYRQWVNRRSYTNGELSATHFSASVKLVSVAIAHIALIGSPSLAAVIIGLIGSVIDADTISALALATLLNHSVNFLLYNIFDDEFRRIVFVLFGCSRKDEKPVNPEGALSNAVTAGVSKNNE